MSYNEVAKVHKKLGTLLKKANEISENAAKEFVSQHNISIEDIINRKCDWKTILDFNRYISNSTGMERNKYIPKNIAIERINIEDFPAEWLYIPEAEEEKIFFHLFGGGYIMGNLESRRWIPYLVSNATNLRCLTIEYRLAPEYPFPAALDDSVKAFKWLLSEGYNPKKIIIGGESAGGGLTMATLLKLKELELPFPAAAVLMSPWVDLTGSGKSLEINSKYEPELVAGIKLMALAYAQNHSLENPYISPVFADLSGFPPLLIQAGGIEAILDNSIILAEKARTAGIDIKLEVYDNMVHVFQNLGYELSESKKAFENVNKFVQKYI